MYGFTPHPFLSNANRTNSEKNKQKKVSIYFLSCFGHDDDSLLPPLFTHRELRNLHNNKTNVAHYSNVSSYCCEKAKANRWETRPQLFFGLPFLVTTQRNKFSRCTMVMRDVHTVLRHMCYDISLLLVFLLILVTFP